MNFNLTQSIELLERTPGVFETFLHDLPDEWTMANEGGNSWSPFDILGHLIHGEKTDWIPRMNIILSDQENKTFEPFDMDAHYRESKGKTMVMLLEEFTKLRAQNMDELKAKDLSESDLERTGKHPALGEVTLGVLLAAWTVHDLGHISQVSRVMAKQYKEEVGPWGQYLGILQA